jgi:hypothetical protein
MADGEEMIGLGGVGIHECYTETQAYSAGTPERRQARRASEPYWHFASDVCRRP